MSFHGQVERVIGQILIQLASEAVGMSVIRLSSGHSEDVCYDGWVLLHVYENTMFTLYRNR